MEELGRTKKHFNHSNHYGHYHIAEGRALRKSSAKLRRVVAELRKSNRDLRGKCRGHVQIPAPMPGFAPAVIKRCDYNWSDDLFDNLFKGKEIRFLNPGPEQLRYCRWLAGEFAGEYVFYHESEERVAHFFRKHLRG